MLLSQLVISHREHRVRGRRSKEGRNKANETRASEGVVDHEVKLEIARRYGGVAL